MTKTTKKSAPKKATKKVTSARKTVTKTAPKKTFMLKKTGKDKEGNQQYTAVRVYKKMPNGWKDDKNGQAPAGYKSIHNGKSLLSGQRRTGIIKAK